MPGAAAVRHDTAPAVSAEAAPEPGAPALADLRFSALLGAEAWSRLPAPVRRRFSKRVCDGASVAYVGRVVAVSASRLGRALAWAARLVGGPLPVVREPGPAVVCVTEDRTCGGQVWTRTYARPRGFPQVIHSSKRFAGPTGLEEHLGCGLSMALRVAEADGVLEFRSASYALTLMGRRCTLPRWMEPGRLRVSHAELGDGRFSFTLELTHPAFGRLMHQHAVFQEERP